jgi:fructose-1-phosphate kinase PfkB-like protein
MARSRRISHQSLNREVTEEASTIRYFALVVNYDGTLAGNGQVADRTASALERGKPMRDSVLFGVAAGAAAVMTPGTELCRMEDAERLYAKMLSESE